MCVGRRSIRGGGSRGTTSCAPGDGPTYDGIVNFADLGIVIGNYGTSLPPPGSNNPGAAVPEPGTLALLVAGLIGLLAYGWRR